MTPFVIAVERALAWTVRCYEANSHGAVTSLVSRGFRPGAVPRHPNGVDTNGVPQAAHGDRPRPRVVCVARLLHGKRHAVILQALAQLRADGIEFECELVGDGPWLPALRELTSELGLYDCVVFAGTQPAPQVRERLAAAHVFVLASIWEALPGSVLEAMAAGLPLVGTNVNGIRELVVDGETGMLVPPEDPGGLAAALGALLGDPKQRRVMGRRGRERAEADST
jgi:glycosyltransferase involved in cell wall biosynthesis